VACRRRQQVLRELPTPEDPLIRVIRDVVDSVDFRPLGSRDRLRNPRCGNAELPCRVGEGEPEPGHEVDRQVRPHGRDPAPPAAHPELLQTEPGLPAPAANERLGFAEPLSPGPLRLLPRIASGQHPLHERAGAQDPLVGEDVVRPLADGPDLGPAAQGADQPPAHQLGAAALREPLPEEGAIGPERAAFGPTEPREHVRPILPRVARAPQNPGMATPGVPVQVGQIRDQPRPQRIEVDVAHQLAEVGLLSTTMDLYRFWKRCPTRLWRRLYPRA